MWCRADGREIPHISMRKMCLHLQRSICLRRPWRRRHQNSYTMRQSLIQCQNIPCQKRGIVLAEVLPYPVNNLPCYSEAWKVNCNLCCWVGSYCVGGYEKLVVEGLPYGCSLNGTCRVIQFICVINLPTSELKKNLPFRCCDKVPNMFSTCALLAQNFHQICSSHIWRIAFLFAIVSCF
jgi:hypothetical protein